MGPPDPDGNSRLTTGSWRAGCGGSRTSGSGSGPGKRADGNAGPAPWSDSTNRLLKLDGVNVTDVVIGADTVTVEVALRRRKLRCPAPSTSPCHGSTGPGLTHIHAGRASFGQTLEDVIEGCEAAWGFFDPVFAVIIPDHLKAIADQADALAPWSNPTFLEYAQARGFVIDSARVRKPTDKPRVERMVSFVRGSL